MESGGRRETENSRNYPGIDLSGQKEWTQDGFYLLLIIGAQGRDRTGTELNSEGF